MARVNLQPKEFKGTDEALAIWRMENLAMEALQTTEGVVFKAYLWSCLDGLDKMEVKNWQWLPIDVEDVDELEDIATNYVNTEEDQPEDSSPQTQSMFRFLDLLQAGRQFLESVLKFKSSLNQ